MNAARRKEIEKARGLIEEAKQILEQAQSEEDDYYGNMPENMQQGDKGQKAEQAASELQEAVDSLDGVLGNIETATE